MIEQIKAQSVKSLVIFFSGVAYVLSIVMMEVLVGVALGAITDNPLLKGLIVVGILGTLLSACLIPLALHYWLSPGIQFIVGIIFWLVDVAVLAMNASTGYQLMKGITLDDVFTTWQLMIPFVGPALTILGWGTVYLTDDTQKDSHAERLLETSKRDLMRKADLARAKAEHDYAMKQIEQVKQSLMLALQSNDIAQLAERGAYNSALNITRQIVGMPVQAMTQPQPTATTTTTIEPTTQPVTPVAEPVPPSLPLSEPSDLPLPKND